MVEQEGVDIDFRAVVEHAHEGLVLFDGRGRYLHVNPAAQRLSNIVHAEVRGRHYLDVYPDIAGGDFDRAFRRVAASRQPETVEVQYSPWNRWFVNELIPLAEDLICVSTAEITHVKRQEAMVRFQERFVAVLSHDLRNPLGAIVMGAGILRRTRLSAAQDTIVTRITRSATRMSRMIGQLLDLTRARLGDGLSVTRKEADMLEIARAVLDELHLAHPDRQVRLASDGETSGQWDIDRIAQAISNLVGNAIAHGRADAPIDVEVRGSERELCVSVRNAGGIASEELPLLFEPYRRGAKSSKESGLGLGLFIVHEIATAHDGSVRVRSAEDETIFELTLPRCAPPG